MSEVVSSKPATTPSKAGRRWLNIIGRVLVAVVMVLAVLGIIVNVLELVGLEYGPPTDQRAAP